MAESALVATFRAVAARVPAQAALVAGDETLTYAELEGRAAASATAIAAHARGQSVGLLLPNHPAFAWTLLGALWAGKTVALLPSLAPPPLLRRMAEQAGLGGVLTSAELAPRLAESGVATLPLEQFPRLLERELPLAARAQEAAILLYTSGTTGQPKAVALSERNILSNIEGCCRAAGFGEREVMLAILPLFHAFGLTVTLLLPLVIGGTVVLLERFAPRPALQAIARHRVTAVVGVPSQFRLVAREPTRPDTNSLRLCIAGAERLPEKMAAEFQDRFAQPLLQGYGATEASPVISLNPPDANRPGTVGRPLPNLRVSIHDDGREMGTGARGEVWVEGPSIMLGYHNDPQATAEKVSRGALRTGDRGFLDAEGYLHLVGRADDLIKVAGEKVYPAEVEQVLDQMDGVEEAVVIGVSDEKHGAVLRAFVRPRPGTRLTEAGLRAACRQRLEAAKVPRSFVVVEELPRAPSGKVDKRLLAIPKPA